MKFNLAIAGLFLVGMLAMGTGCEEGNGLLIGAGPGGTTPASGSVGSTPKPSPTPSGDLGGKIIND